MPDEPSPSEIRRSLDDLRRAVDRLGEKVLTLDVWRVEREALEQRFKAVEEDVKDLQTERRGDAARQENRRWLIYLALVAAALSFLSNLYFNGRGA